MYSRLEDFTENEGVDIKEKMEKRFVDCRYVTEPEDKKQRATSLF
jgi:hypothetical protein